MKKWRKFQINISTEIKKKCISLYIISTLLQDFHRLVNDTTTNSYKFICLFFLYFVLRISKQEEMQRVYSQQAVNSGKHRANLRQFQ